jgi:hypothetical protein
MATYLVCMYFASLALGYVHTFTIATLSIGRSLSDFRTPSGYRHFITPRSFRALAIVVCMMCAGGLIYGVWRFGWLVGFGIIIGFFFAVFLNRTLILPKSGSEHFRKIIIRSLINRHADYLKAGHTIGAYSTAMLLEKLGLPVYLNDFVNRIKKSGDA